MRILSCCASCINMKTSVIKELYWTIGAAIATGTIGLLFFATRLWDGQPIEVQLPDTDLTFSKYSFLAIIFSILLTGCYLTRAIYYRLKNRLAIGILTFLLIVFLTGQLVYLKWINGFEYHIAPVIDKGDYFQMQDVPGSKEYKVLIWTLILVTATTLATAGHRLIKQKT